MTIDSIKTITRCREWEEEHTDPDEPELTFGDDQWPKTMEALDEYLHGCLGATKIPLSYVVRKDVDVKASEDDPPEEHAILQHWKPPIFILLQIPKS